MLSVPDGQPPMNGQSTKKVTDKEIIEALKAEAALSGLLSGPHTGCRSGL